MVVLLAPERAGYLSLGATFLNGTPDTFGISSWPPDHLVVSWGSATPPAGKTSEIFAATVTVSLP